MYSVTFYDFGRKIDSFGVNFIVFEAFGSLQKCSLKMKFQGENDSHFFKEKFVITEVFYVH